MLSILLVGKNPDLQIAVGMLTLILYFEMGEDELFVRSYRSLYRVLMKWQDRYSMEINILKSIRKFPLLLERITEAEFFSNLKAQIQMIREDPQHGRAVQYFNFDTWLESKIKGTSILEVIRSLMQNN